MSYQITTIDITTQEGVKTRNSFLYHESPAYSRLLVLLPGRGYTGDMPLLYHLRKAAAALGYDVLTVQYSFHVAPEIVTFEQLGWDGVNLEVGQIIAAAMERGYDQVCIAGKSLGTPPAVTQVQTLSVAMTSLILLTPIGGCVAQVNEVPTLAVIGTTDRAYDAGHVNETGQKANVDWMVLEGLGHSLEADDWRDSLDILRAIVERCEGFLKRVQHSGK